MRVVWGGTHNGFMIRVVDRGAGHLPRMAIEYQAPAAAMGEPTWLPFQQFDLDLITQICLALGIIQ